MTNPLDITTAHQQSQLQIHGIPVSDLLSVSAVIVAAYAALQAAKSARATAQANIQAVLPVLTIEYVPERGTLGGYVNIRNTGQGHAFAVSIPKYIMYWTWPGVLQQAPRVELQLQAVPDDLAPGVTRRLRANGTENGESVNGRNLLTGIVMNSGRKITVPIRYRDVVGNRYITYVETGRGSVRIVRPSKRLNFTEIIRYYGCYRLRDFLKGRFLWLRHRVFVRPRNNHRP